jgi:hypothetical protein
MLLGVKKIWLAVSCILGTGRKKNSPKANVFPYQKLVSKAREVKEEPWFVHIPEELADYEINFQFPYICQKTHKTITLVNVA